MGTISRSTKQGGTTSLQDGQTAPAADVDTDMVTIFTEVNGLLDDGNLETATMPGAKSFRFSEISAPSSPSANDVLLYAFDVGSTTVLAAKDSGGTVFLPGGRIGCRVYNSADISVASGSSTALTFDTERYDLGGCHSTASATGKLTAPIAGRYLIFAAVGVETDTDYTTFDWSFRVNTTTIIAVDRWTLAFSSGTHYRMLSTVYALAASDTVELFVTQVNTSAGAANVDAQLNWSPEFGFQLIGN